MFGLRAIRHRLSFEKPTRIHRALIAGFLAVVVAFHAARPAEGQESSVRIIRVKAGAMGANDGTSWTDAYQDLQDALNDARVSGNIDAEIWVAAGIYKPDRGTGDRTLAFELADKIALYGGFTGEEQCRDERDPTIMETILTGDLGDDDYSGAAPPGTCCRGYQGCDDDECRSLVVANDPTCAVVWRSRCAFYAVSLCCDLCRPTRCENSFNVVRAIDTDSSAILDGFIIQGGEALDLALDLPNPYGLGGGLSCDNCQMHVSKCTFRSNNAWTGAAMGNLSGNPTVSDTVFVENSSDLVGSFALEASAWPTDTVRIVNCTFMSNRGSGAVIVSSAPSRIEDCSFVGNLGHGLVNERPSDITGCSFIGNQRTAIWAQDSIHVMNSRFIGNSDPWGGGRNQHGRGKRHDHQLPLFGKPCHRRRRIWGQLRLRPIHQLRIH